MDPQEALILAVTAVRRASKVCQRVQADLVNAETLEKKDKSPVTVADFASQAVICAALRDAFPDVPVVGEEGSAELRDGTHAALLASVATHAMLDEDAALEAIDFGAFDPVADRDVRTYWTLDPIDGTKGFLRGEQYAVALALIEDGEVTLGVLGCPNLNGGVAMVARKGGGAERLALDGGESFQGAPVRVSDEKIDNAKLCESVESGHSDHDASHRISEALGITREPYRIDSQCKYAAVAMGLADVYLRLPTRPGYAEKIWDHAAGNLVVEEAGGTVTDIHGVAHDFGQGKTLRPDGGVVCTNGNFHDKVVDAVSAALA
ncbi:MAG: 3'(2'),5'-bisphosphate nucleotidase [Planctomycetota bacterium]